MKLRSTFPRQFRWLFLAVALSAALPLGALGARNAVPIPGGDFMPLFGADPGARTVRVAPFRMDVNPVTNGEFFAFTLAHAEWAPGRVDDHRADSRYLSHWEHTGSGTPQPGAGQMDRPVTFVSWHAADAFCQAQGGLLPTVFQWEFAAAASETRADARKDPGFIGPILAWYSQPFRLEDLEPVGRDTANFYGVRDLHRLVWEWTDDFDSPRFTGAGGRGEGDPSDRSCGAGAYGAQGVEDYAAFMRFALRTSLQGHYTTASVGFRCAYAARSPGPGGGGGNGGG
jgi:formylglycine-generating enzyme required for sulfatase activity